MTIFFVSIIAMLLIVFLFVLIEQISKYQATDKEKIMVKDIVKSEEIVDFHLISEISGFMLFLNQHQYYNFHTKSNDKLEEHKIFHSIANIKIIEDGSKPRFETISIKTYHKIIKIPKIWKFLNAYKKYDVGELILYNEDLVDTIYVTENMMKNCNKENIT